MEKKLSLRDWIMRFSAALLCCCLLAVAVRYGTQRFVVDRLCIDNEITRFITTGHTWKDTRAWKKIDWAKEYPFAEEATGQNKEVKAVQKKDASVKTPEKKNGIRRILSSARQKVHAKKQRFLKERKGWEEWTGRNFPAYYTLVEGKRFYDRLTGWESYNLKKENIVKVADNVFTDIVPNVEPKKMEPRVRAVKQFENFCRSQGAEFIYVCAPFKISRDDERKHGEEWNVHANARADIFMNRLCEENILTLDIRDIIEKKYQSNFPFFFETDHHWKPETALLAAGVLAKRLKNISELGFEYNPIILNPDNYEKIVYEKNFLGSYGRRITRANASPEDISVFYPKEKTSFHISVPSRRVDKEGDFSVGYDYRQVQEGAYYDRDAYWVYAYGSQAYKNIVNYGNPEGLHALLIRDSFAGAMEMFFARTLSRLEVLDLRHFTGSVETLIREHHPDIVVILYNPGVVGGGVIDKKSHKDLFDFR